jgi:hypothetical protein
MHLGAELSNTSDLSDRDSDTSHTSAKSLPGRGAGGGGPGSSSQWAMLASDGGPLVVQHSGARALDPMHPAGLLSNDSGGSSYGGAPGGHSRGAGSSGYPYGDLDFMKTQQPNVPEPVLNTVFSTGGVPYLSDDSLTSSSAPNARSAGPHRLGSYASSLRDGAVVGGQGYRHNGNDTSYSASYRAGKLSDSSSSSASISSKSTDGARSSSSFVSDGYRSNAAALLSSHSANDLFASDFGGMFSLDQGSSVIMTSQGPLPSGGWSIRSLSSAGDVSSVAAPSFTSFDQNVAAESMSEASAGTSIGDAAAGLSVDRSATQGTTTSGGRGLLGDAIRQILSIDTSIPPSSSSLPASNHGSLSTVGPNAGVPPPPSVPIAGPAHLVSPKSLRNRPQIAVDCPDKIRRRSVSDSLPFEVAEAVLGTPPGSPASTPTLGAHRKFLTASAPRSSNGSPKVITPSHSFEGYADEAATSSSSAAAAVGAAAAGGVLSSSSSSSSMAGPGPLVRTSSGSRTLADALLSVKDSP